MISTIVKRDGRQDKFDMQKITDAIYAAAHALGGTDYEKSKQLSEKVVADLEQQLGKKPPTVEQIQDAVEKTLIENGHSRTAKEFILYRAQRSQVREMNTRLMRLYEDLTFKEAADVDVKRENANINGDTAMGTMLKYGSEGAKQFNELFVIDKEFSQAHIRGDIHIHDMDFLTLTTTCCQIDLEKLFETGFSTGHGYVREPNDIQTYSALACIAIQANQNDQHGGQSVPNFEYAMAKGVRKTYIKRYRENLAKALELNLGTQEAGQKAYSILKQVEQKTGLVPALANDNGYQQEELAFLLSMTDEQTANKIQKFTAKYSKQETDRATYQAMEALVHNLNTMHSRAGAQIPFSSLNYGLDTTPEGRLVIEKVLLATEAGLGNGETPIFPIHIFKVKEGISFSPGDPNYDLFQLACRVSAKRLFPNFSFLDAPFNAQYYVPGRPETEASYMGCRTRVIGNAHDPDRQIVNGRGNLSFTSVNLPRLAIKSSGNVEFFFEQLEAQINLVIRQLLQRFKIQSQKRVKNFPFLMGQGIWIDSEHLSAEDEIGEVIKHGTLTIGFIGLAETLKALIGKHHGESQEAQNLGLDIIGFMRKRMDDAAKQYGLNFSLIATPAEGLSGRFVKMDRQKYGVVEGVTDRNYYTNSFHVPVYHSIAVYDKIRLEAPYHALTNGGHISYVELDGDTSNNLEAFEQIIRFMKESGVGYGSINHPVDRDPVCGYTGIIGETCPRCGRREGEGIDVEVLRKLSGYNADYRTEEEALEQQDRVMHQLS